MLLRDRFVIFLLSCLDNSNHTKVSRDRETPHLVDCMNKKT